MIGPAVWFSSRGAFECFLQPPVQVQEHNMYRSKNKFWYMTLCDWMDWWNLVVMGLSTSNYNISAFRSLVHRTCIYFLDLGTTSWFPKLCGKQVLIFKKSKFQFWHKQNNLISYQFQSSYLETRHSLFSKTLYENCFSFRQWNPNSIEGIYFLILCSGLEDVDWNWKNNQNNIVDIVAQIYD